MQDSKTKSQPSEKELREFWEWCELESVSFFEGKWIHVVDGVVYYLDLDLNNLFKYAVPKLANVRLSKTDTHKEYVAVVTEYTPLEKESKVFNEDPALALFWAIWGVIHG